MSGERTLIDFLNSARSFLEQKGFENPRGNAEALLCKTLNLPRIELYLQHDRPLSETEVSSYREYLRRRLRHEPLQYILGEIEFFGVSLDVTPGVLIPRPETEELVERLVDWLRNHGAHERRRVLDIGCGSGCIAVALAACLPALDIDAVDADYDAIVLTQRNAAKHEVTDRVHTLRADILKDGIEGRLSPPYHVLVSNPPYIAEADIYSLQAEVQDFEPHNALSGGEDGLLFYRRIAELIPGLVAGGGLIALEVGRGQGETVAEMLRALGAEAEILADMSGQSRFVMGNYI